MDDLEQLLWQSVEIAHGYRVAAVVWAGDVFHSKAPSRTSHALVKRIAKIGQAYGVPWYIVPGNHDMSNDLLSSVLLAQPLAGLLDWKDGASLLIGRSPRQPELYGVPWLQDWSDESVSGALEAWRQDEYAGRHGLVVTHAPLYPPGTELPYEFYPPGKWAAAMEGHGACYYGHVHEYHGVWADSGVVFCNPGALSRGSLHEHNRTRRPSVVIWDSTTPTGAANQFEIIPLDAKPAEEVFRLRQQQEVVDSHISLDSFVASISGTTLGMLSAEAVHQRIQQMQVDKSVEAEVMDLLEFAEHQE